MAARLRYTRTANIPDRPVLRAMEEWLFSMQASTSKNTRIAYRQSVEQFAASAGNPGLATVTASDVRHFIDALQTAGRAPQTLHTHYRHLRTFFNWCAGEEWIERSPMATVAAPKVPKTFRVGYTDEEVNAMIAACDPRTAFGARDRAIIATLLGTGLRLEELVSLRRDDVMQNGKMATTVRVRGKGNKERFVPIQNHAREAISRYLFHRDDTDQPLWIGQRGELGRLGVYDIVRRIGERAGVKGAHPHRWRNTALAGLLKADVPAESVMAVAGHTSMQMLQQYVEYDQQRRANDRVLAAQAMDRYEWGTRGGGARLKKRR